MASVVSLNLKRRHLTPSQRAMVAVEMLPWLEQEAMSRQGKRTDIQEGVSDRLERVTTHGRVQQKQSQAVISAWKSIPE